MPTIPQTDARYAFCGQGLPRFCCNVGKGINVRQSCPAKTRLLVVSTQTVATSPPLFYLSSPRACSAPTTAPTLVPTPGPTMLSSRPELEEARLAAALMGMDLTIGLGRASSGDEVRQDLVHVCSPHPRASLRRIHRAWNVE